MQPVERSQLSTRIHEPCTNARSLFMASPNCLTCSISSDVEDFAREGAAPFRVQFPRRGWTRVSCHPHQRPGRATAVGEDGLPEVPPVIQKAHALLATQQRRTDGHHATLNSGDAARWHLPFAFKSGDHHLEKYVFFIRNAGGRFSWRPFRGVTERGPCVCGMRLDFPAPFGSTGPC